MFKTFISPPELSRLIRSGQKLLIFDTRFSLADTELGQNSYLESHIPTAFYAHLDLDLSGPIFPGRSGRHPLPDPEFFTERLRLWGLERDAQVVVYDDDNGGIAARLWWMLRWAGHDAVAVLDGGWRAWIDFGGDQTDQIPEAVKSDYAPDFRDEMAVQLLELLTIRNAEAIMLIDARTPDRYAGENETIDPVAGHIPGALNLSYKDTADSDGRSKSPETLRRLFEQYLKGQPADSIVFYCGSGVTACRNVLAMEHAGLSGSKVYPGSWSQWIRHRSEIAVGTIP